MAKGVSSNKNDYKKVDEVIGYFLEHLYVANRTDYVDEVKLIICHTNIKLNHFIM